MKIKLKSKSAFKKRFRPTGKGKLKRWGANSSHRFYPGKKSRSGSRKSTSLLDKSDLVRFRKVC